MPFTVLINLVGQGAQAPILVFRHRAAAIGDQASEAGRQVFDLLGGDVLTDDKDVLV